VRKNDKAEVQLELPSLVLSTGHHVTTTSSNYYLERYITVTDVMLVKPLSKKYFMSSV
jgi:hypothetical protein